MRAIVLGGAECVWCDVEDLEPLVGGEWRTYDRDAPWFDLMGEYLPACEKHGRVPHRVPVDWPGMIVAVNDFGCWWPGPLDHWVSLHPERFTHQDGWENPDGPPHGWEVLRERNGHPDGYLTWAKHRRKLYSVDRTLTRWMGGSSGKLGADVAKEAGADRPVLCGVPMVEGMHFPESTVHYGKGPWSAASADSHYRGWKREAEKLAGTVKSMSGRTRNLLGEPTRQWLETPRQSEAA